jgi:hypothetical protein
MDEEVNEVNKFEYEIVKNIYNEILNGKLGVDYAATQNKIEEGQSLDILKLIVEDNESPIPPFTKKTISILEKMDMVEDLRMINKEQYMSMSPYVAKYHMKFIAFKDLRMLIEVYTPSSYELGDVTNNFFGNIENAQIQQKSNNSKQIASIKTNDQMSEVIKEVFKYSNDVMFLQQKDKTAFLDLVKELDTSYPIEKNNGVLHMIKDFLGKALMNVVSTGLLQFLTSVL